MDPNTTWRDMLTALADRDHEEARDCAALLARWIDRGGFYPSGVEPREVTCMLATVLGRRRHSL